jgi:hypothetical protein
VLGHRSVGFILMAFLGVFDAFVVVELDPIPCGVVCVRAQRTTRVGMIIHVITASSLLHCNDFIR